MVSASLLLNLLPSSRPGGGCPLQCYDSHLQVAEGYFDALVHSCQATEPAHYPRQEPSVVQTLLYLAFYKVSLSSFGVTGPRCSPDSNRDVGTQLADGKVEARRKAVELIKWLSDAVDKALRLNLQTQQVQPYYNMAVASSLQRDVGYASWQVPGHHPRFRSYFGSSSHR